MKMPGIRFTTFMILAAFFVAGCGSKTNFSFFPDSDQDKQENESQPDGDSDGDSLSDGDISPDGDPFVDGDWLPDGDPETGSFTLSVRMTNRGQDAAYVVYKSPGLPGHLGLTLMNAMDEVVQQSADCTIPCGDTCEPMLCEPMLPIVRQILPGDSVVFSWDGGVVDFDTCYNDAYGDVQCYRKRKAEAGAYHMSFCYNTLLSINDGDYPTRHTEDLLDGQVNATLCQEFDVTVENDKNNIVEKDFSATMGQDRKPWGYCGQAWTYGALTPTRFVTGLHGRAGSSMSVPVTPEFTTKESEPCWRWGNMRFDVNTSQRKLNLYTGLFTGEHDCENPFDQLYFAYVVPPLEVGDWTAVLAAPYGRAIPVTSHFEVEPCTSCEACPASPSSDLAESCDADCFCSTPDAVCDISKSCWKYCLSNLDCQGGTHCSFGPIQMPILTCNPQTEHECISDYDCQRKGEHCPDTSGVYRRCRPELDTRGGLWENMGRGIHCGCDAECPGTQSCIRYEFNFTEGFCAITCRDQRDCPAGWTCLEQTQSGLEAICVPPLPPE